jgi:hypothetical protein
MSLAVASKYIKILRHKSPKNICKICTWWYTPLISALVRLWQKDHKFKAKLGYTVSSRSSVAI